MNSTLATLVILLCVQLAVGVPLTNNGDRTTKHWEKQPREKTTKHIEIEPRGTTITHWEVPEILPREQNQDSMKNSEILLTEEPPFEGGNGTVPTGAVNDGGDKEIIMVPFGLIVGSGIIPPGALNEGGDKEINMVPSGLVVGSGILPPGALNDGGDKDIIMVPYVISKAPFDNTPPVPENPWNGSQGTPPPGAQNDWSSSSFMRGARFLLRAFGF